VKLSKDAKANIAMMTETEKKAAFKAAKLLWSQNLITTTRMSGIQKGLKVGYSYSISGRKRFQLK
jgi:hypothetical protein